MKPKSKSIKLYANSAYSEDVQILGTDGLPKDITSWTFRVAAKRSRASSTVDLTGTATVTDGADGTVNIYFAQDDVAALLADGVTDLSLERWDLLCKPGVDYPVLVMYGSATIEAGSTPAW